MLDFIRIACAVPSVKVGDVRTNVRDICEYMDKADGQGADIIMFPELALTGFTCGDLFFQDALIGAVKAGLAEICRHSAEHPNITVVVGLPVRVGAKLYNCAAVIARGEVSGLVPKTQLESAEKRWFASSLELERIWLEPEDIGLVASEDYWSIPVDSKLLFRMGNDAVVGVEICEDLLTPQPRCADLAVNSAEVILNLSASNELVGKRTFRRDVVKHQSAVCSCIYAYTSAGYTESTSDLIYSGHSLIAEGGRVLAENAQPIDTDYYLIQDCDLGRIRSDRRRTQNFGLPGDKSGYLVRSPYGDDLRSDDTLYPVSKLPFVPSSKEARKIRCMEIFGM